MDGFPNPELLNYLADGAYITDVNRRIIFWNRAAERITGWSATDMVGKSCYDNLLCHVDKEGHSLCGHDTCPLHQSIVNNQPSVDPVLVFAQCKSHRRLPMEVSVAPVTNQNGDVIGGIEIFRDMRNNLHDLLRAKAIQEQSLACHLPTDRRVEFQTVYNTREIVGGDFYRIERVSANHYAFMVADAIGHGLATALYTMQMSTLWDDHREQLNAPAFFMRTLNKRLHGLVQDAGFFATALFVSYDATCGHLRCIRAGHASPVILRANLQAETIGQSQSALGMWPDVHYIEFQAQLAPGDTLLAFSDGATEIFNSDQNLLGIDGLVNMAQNEISASPEKNLNLETLAEKLLVYSKQIHLDDDLTLLKLHRIT
jgi:PAS domain S-box-containing protein